jgi:transposase-like protein
MSESAVSIKPLREVMNDHIRHTLSVVESKKEVCRLLGIGKSTLSRWRIEERKRDAARINTKTVS